MIEKVVENLRKNKFLVHYFENSKDACDYLIKVIPPGAKVGIGGSITLNQIGFVEALQNRKDIIFFNQYLKNLPRETSLQIRREGLLSDYYFTGSNAITEEGEIVNIDGVGNRVAALSFGPKKVFIVVGKNKIVKNYNEAIKRIKTIAAPLNAKRLGRHTPCVDDGICHNCDSPDRICNIVHVLKKQPYPERITVVLIDEKLGL